MPLQSLRRAWKKKSWMKHLSGLTCEHSIADRGVKQWISSLRDIPASHSACAEDGKPQKTKDTCGRQSGRSLKRQNQNSVSLKMSQTIYDWALNRSMMTYDQWVSALRQACSQRRKSVHRINGSAFSSSPTPKGRKTGLPMWATVISRDWKDSSPNNKVPTNSVLGRQAPRSMNVGDPSQLRLNPRFTEWIIGWPTGWTEFTPVGTAWCHWWRHMHGAFLRLVSALQKLEQETLI